jgi:sensor histidine kinase YesM
MYDALVPTMILQPLVENAYVHGLSQVSDGLIEITAKEEGGELCIQVRNSGIGLMPANRQGSSGMGIGLTNIRNRLRLHFGNRGSLEICEMPNTLVEATVKLPAIFADSDEGASLQGQDSLSIMRQDAQVQ